MQLVTFSISFVTMLSLGMSSRVALGLKFRGNAGTGTISVRRRIVAVRQLASGVPAEAATDKQGGDHGSDAAELCVVSSAIDFLETKNRMVGGLSPAAYTAFDEVVGASVGGHVRHTLDHFAKCMAALPSTTTRKTPVATAVTPPRYRKDMEDREEGSSQVIRYDDRERKGVIEKDPQAASALIGSMLEVLKQLPRGELASQLLRAVSVTPAFMLSDGSNRGEHAFESNLEREIFFCCHHGVHHDAMIRLILQRMDTVEARAALSSDLGVATSTADHRERSTEADASQR